MRKELNLIIGASLALILSGCASKNVGSSESSAKILNSYVKKEKPAGWFYNFGIGKNYNEALADADKALSFNNPLSTDTKVTTYGGNALKDGQEVPRNKVKFVEIKPYNIYTSKSKCEIKENWDVPEGILIVRICPDLQFFEDNFSKPYTDGDMKRDLALSREATKVMDYIERESNKKYSKEDIKALLAFKYEVQQMDRYIFNSNFDGMDSEEIIFWVNTTYKKWFNSLGEFSDSRLKEHYGIMYPYMFWYDTQYTKDIHAANQLWKLSDNGVIVSRKVKLSEAQLSGITEIPETNKIKFIGIKGKR